MLVDLGFVDQVIQKLTNEYFLPLEMDQSFREIYVRAYIIHAESLIKANRIEEAIADYHKALDYPENVGVGKLVAERNAEIFYALGCAYELLGRYEEAVDAWRKAAHEYHLLGSPFYTFVQKSLDKLNAYSQFGY
jgi:tetratricopeptide (TPR) repeat protein